MAFKLSFKKRKKKKKKVEPVVYEYDYEEYNEDPRQVILEQRKQERYRLYKRIAAVIGVFLLIVGFFVSDLSKVHSVTIIGNSKVPTETIEKALSITDNSIFLLVSRATIQKDVESVNLIKTAKVTKGLFGDFTITVTENDLVAFAKIKKKTYVVDESGGVTLLTKKMKVKNVTQLPQIANFKTLKMVKRFAKQYVKVPELIRNSISDIVYAPLKADQTRVRLILTNSKELIVRIEDMADNLSEKNFNFEGYMNKYSEYNYFIFEGHYIRMTEEKEKDS